MACLEGQIPRLILANAQHVRALPGEKTDRKDGKRLAELMRHGQVRPSYVPPRAILELRDLTRYRSKLLSAGSSERNRIQKVLEDANIKLGSVLSDVFGLSGQKMLQQLVNNDTVDIANVIQLAHWKLKPKMEAIEPLAPKCCEDAKSPSIGFSPSASEHQAASLGVEPG